MRFHIFKKFEFGKSSKKIYRKSFCIDVHKSEVKAGNKSGLDSLIEKFKFTIESAPPKHIDEELTYVSHFISVAPADDKLLRGYKLHMMQICSASNHDRSLPSCFLLHGAIENGTIFYSKNGKGLAPYLAKNGFNVFVPDLRGHGESFPKIREEKHAASYGQHHTITETIPLLACAIHQLSRGNAKKQVWLSHSWGGLLLTSSMVRFPAELMRSVLCQVHFGTKRIISATNSFEYLKLIAFGWRFLLPIAAKFYGYLPSKEFKVGSDDDTFQYLQDTNSWLKQGAKWIDTEDGFDYKKAQEELILRYCNSNKS
jgi:pimeloyl-ACP methyl ester carboxylesterase